MNSSHEHVEKGAHKAPPKWKALGSNLRKHHIHTSIVAVGAFGITYVLTEINWEHRELARIIVSLAVTVTAEIFLDTYLRLRDRSETIQRDAEELLRSRGKCDTLNMENQLLETALQRFGQYFSLDRRSDMLSVLGGDDNGLSRTLYNRHFKQQQHFNLLLTGHRTIATYKDQHEYADILASSANKRLWTTCVDLPADFQERNYSYMASLTCVSARLQSEHKAAPPSKCRIFIGGWRDLFDDARERYDKWIDLYKWHLRWGIGENVVTVRFLPVGNNHDYHRLFLNGGMSREDIIHDFMVVDNRLVYGRNIETFAIENFHLYLIDRDDVVQKYDQLYRQLWAQSIDVYKLIDRLLAEQGESKELLGLKEQCHKADSKLHIMSDYGNIFTSTERKGISFFNRVCDEITKGGKVCFAVDRAAKKERSLWESWTEFPYRVFRDASVAAAQSPETYEFYRLFVLEEKIPTGDREKVSKFIESFVTNKIRVGFILREDTGMDEIEQRYDTDFIVVGYQDKNAGDQQSTALGFELQDEDFKAAELSIESNLIAKGRLAQHHQLFSELWNNPKTTVVLEDRNDNIKDAVDKLLAEG